MANVSEDRHSYSKLEVFEIAEEDTLKHKVSEDGCRPIALDPHAFPEVISGQDVANAARIEPLDTDEEVLSFAGRRRKQLIVLGISVGIVIVFGAVIGGVLGSRHSRNQAESPTPTQDPAVSASDENCKQVASTSFNLRLDQLMQTRVWTIAVLHFCRRVGASSCRVYAKDYHILHSLR